MIKSTDHQTYQTFLVYTKSSNAFFYAKCMDVSQKFPKGLLCFQLIAPILFWWSIAPLSKALRFEDACKKEVIDQDDETQVSAFCLALSSALKASAKCVFGE